MASLVGLVGCTEDDKGVEVGHGSIAPNIMAPMGEAIPDATPEELSTFERGEELANRRFTRAEGVGPSFNTTFCASCHERPTTGGAAGTYRNFVLAGVLRDGAFFPADSDVYTDRTFNSVRQGVVRIYHYAQDALFSGGEDTAKPELPDDLDVTATRNPIPFFGVGLLAELSEEEILSRADPDDEDGDGISGRPNYEDGVIGRFGVKAQTASLVGFIRGPLFNHLGITTNPLTEDELEALPVDSSGGPTDGAVDMRPCDEREEGDEAASLLAPALRRRAQAAAPAGPLCDDDDAADPELSNQGLFDIVAFTMLLAAPKFEPLSEEGERGQEVFDAAGCGDCHVPRLEGPRGPIPAYSDLLLHDMGPELADGIAQGEAEGSEFRTQPLWGVAATGPYLHDGRAHTLQDAILWHGGEAKASRDAFMEASEADQQALVEFLLSLGGRDQYSPGLVQQDAPIPEVGEYGGPIRELSDDERDEFLAGRNLYDREFGFSEGVGEPRFNGDSCRACHFEPVLGGAGPRGVNVIRHGILSDAGEFFEPDVGTILHRATSVTDMLIDAESEANVFELRQTPHTLGLGLLDRVPDDAIIARADPEGEREPTHIRGRAPILDDGRLGKFGWKAQVPSVREFVRDAATAEIGFTVREAEGLTFGQEDEDPELPETREDQLTRFLHLLGPPPRQETPFPSIAAQGEELFEQVGCADCHVPELETEEGTPVPAYTDLLLHEVLPEGASGIEQGAAGVREFRTAPLWGLSQTAPYMHAGRADTIEEAIRLHDGTASQARDEYLALTPELREAVLVFLRTL